VGARIFPVQLGLLDTHRAGAGRYFHHTLAAEIHIQALLTALKLNNRLLSYFLLL